MGDEKSLSTRGSKETNDKEISEPVRSLTNQSESNQSLNAERRTCFSRDDSNRHFENDPHPPSMHTKYLVRNYAKELTALEFFWEKIQWMDDDNFTLTRSGRYLMHVERYTLEECKRFSQLKDRMEIKSGSHRYRKIEGEKEFVLEQVRKECPKIGPFHVIASWDKYTLVLEDGTHFNRINFPDKTDYFYFSVDAKHMDQLREEEIIDQLSSPTDFIVSKNLQDTPLYKELIDKGQLIGNEHRIDEDNQAGMYFDHTELVAGLFRKNKLPLQFSLVEYNRRKNIDTTYYEWQRQMWTEYVENMNMSLENRTPTIVHHK